MSSNTKKAPPSTTRDEQSPPLEMPTKLARKNLLKQVVDNSEYQKGVNIREIEKKWHEKLWSIVEQAKRGSNTFALAPIEEIYANPNQCEFDTNSTCRYVGSIESQESLDKDLKEIPQYLGENEAK